MKYYQEKIKNGPNRMSSVTVFTILTYANELLVNHSLVI